MVECLDDRDDSIRLRALDLISGMVSKKNLMEIVKKLMAHMDSSESASTSGDGGDGWVGGYSLGRSKGREQEEYQVKGRMDG